LQLTTVGFPAEIARLIVNDYCLSSARKRKTAYIKCFTTKHPNILINIWQILLLYLTKQRNPTCSPNSRRMARRRSTAANILN